MLKIRLTRRGKKNSAFFRIVVAEHTAPIKGGFLEVVGFLNPHTKEKSFKADRIEYWIGKGAQCSDTVHNLLVSNDVIKGSKRAVKLKKKPVEPISAEASTGEGEKKVEASIEASTESSTEKKTAETAEVKPEEMKPEPASAKGSGGAKEEKEPETAKPEPEAKEAETKETKADAK